MSPDDDQPPLSENEAALFAALTAVIQTVPVGEGRARLGALLEEARTDFLQDGKAQSAAILSVLSSYATTGQA